jgi:hypothetical protein
LKKFTIRCLVSFALVVITIFFFRSEIYGDWSYLELFFEVVAVVIILQFIYLLMKKVITKSFILKLLTDYLITLALVLYIGYIRHWWILSQWWTMLFIITVIFICAYFVDFIHIKRDTKSMNEQIQRRNKPYNN